MKDEAEAAIGRLVCYGYETIFLPRLSNLKVQIFVAVGQKPPYIRVLAWGGPHVTHLRRLL